MVFNLGSLIDDYIAQQDKKEFTCWRASQIGGCPRAHFYKRAGVAPTTPPDERTNRIFQAGHIFHEFVQRIAEQHAKWVNIEQELYDESLDTGGRYDLLLEINGEKVLYDIKSQHSRSFWWMAKQAKAGKPILEQYPHHKTQLGTYLLLLRRKGVDVKKGRIFYLSKDDLAYEEVTMTLTPDLEKKILDEIKLLNSHWKAQTPPPCTCEGWRVKYCDFGGEEKENNKSITCCSEQLWEEHAIQSS